MRLIILIFTILLTIVLCKDKKKTDNISFDKKPDSSNIKIDDWQKGFELTHNPDIDSIWQKPVKYYISNKNCDSTAIKFYLGVYRTTDEPETARLLNLITTDNDSLRPFYRWILNKTILIQDGALGEYTGLPARKYAEKFPKEFFEYMDSDKSGKKYLDWVNSILYSGFYENENDYPPKKPENMRNRMFKNCKNCLSAIKSKIEKFSEDCFPQE